MPDLAPPTPASGLAGRHLVLGLTGGIACYKAAELLRALVKAGATVQVVMTEAATHFITPTTMQALSGRPVVLSAWDEREPNAMAHINLTRGSDAVVVAPASTDFIARLAAGRCDGILDLACIARPMDRCALLLAPAMNREMWAHPATQRNVAQVVADGAVILGPAAGEQACGEVGDGRMLEPEELLEDLESFFQPKALLGRSVVVTAGPTFEPLDPVRGLTNRSSGKMGFAIARAACEAGAQVTLVAGPVHLPTPRGVRRIDVQTAREMLEATVPLAGAASVFVATAAVADWRPASMADRKIKKTAERRTPGAIELVENPDILATVAALPASGALRKPFCVGFAAESHDLEAHARDKLERKQLDMVCANLGPATFGRDDNALLMIERAGAVDLGHADKLTLARRLVGEIAARLAPQRT